MGQKINPTGLRIGVIKDWESRWYADKANFGGTLVSDYKTREYLLKALASQLITFGSIPNLDRLLTIVESGVRTDLSAGNISFFLREFLKLDQENVRFHLLPGTGVSIRGGSYYQLDVEGTVDMVNAALNPFNQPISIDSLDILLSRGSEGAISTAGDVVPLTSFFNFGSLTA